MIGIVAALHGWRSFNCMCVCVYVCAPVGLVVAFNARGGSCCHGEQYHERNNTC